MPTQIKKFIPIGPFDLDFENMPGGKRITKEHVKDFWVGKDELKNKIGVYIFGMRVTNTILPCYVGKTNNRFEKECFTDRNMNIFNGEIIRYRRNYQPFIFFLEYQPEKNKKISDKVIRELETYIINLAAEKNLDLANTRSIDDEERFNIVNIGGHGQGRGAPTREGKFFKTMMDF